ncbi:M4 family metallopeptidase [Paenibacillus amylolyticus]|uniref:M4 family metallopeptidase n=1 Tax=Paenibacillus amylolyticus TaxID=1451 RepID=UPI00201E4140|nr:M4 family metallopeptidase [Paenibacillus amylolyticus]MCL6661770.1 M4 family metallopeptidase [Paenibacillus amylolyticus]
MSEHSEHKEGFIPRYVLKQMAERGNKEAEKTLIQMIKIEEKVEKEKKNTQVTNLLHSGNVAERLIYDSENTDEFKRKLIRKEGDPPVHDEVVNITYDFCGKTLDYFKNKLQRNSINNLGMDVIANVHYFNGELNNAFYFSELGQLAFGDGDGTSFKNFARSIDVVAHEMAHGITHFVNDLHYARESGALNEHFSDVIGTAVKQFVKNQTAETADWLIGDEIVGPGWRGKALRSMKAPGTAYDEDKQVAHFDDFDPTLPLEDDNGGVHYYSGIPNKAFFLTATKIGTDKAAFLWYTAWPNIHSNATFKDALGAILKSAETLVHRGELPQETVSVVKNAFEEVGVSAPVPALT